MRALDVADEDQSLLSGRRKAQECSDGVLEAALSTSDESRLLNLPLSCHRLARATFIFEARIDHVTVPFRSSKVYRRFLAQKMHPSSRATAHFEA